MGAIRLTRGDDRTLTIGDFLQPDGTTPYLLDAGDAIKLTVRDARGNIVLTRATGGTGITFTPGEDNALVTLVPADTSGLRAGSYRYDVQITQSTGKVTTVDRGPFIMEADIST